jgi:hypothetical protein
MAAWQLDGAEGTASFHVVQMCFQEMDPRATLAGRGQMQELSTISK